MNGLHSDGTEIRFRTYTIAFKYQSVIKLFTNKNEKEIAQIFNDVGYHKEGSAYFKGTKYEMWRTKCTVSSSGKDSGSGVGIGSGRKTLTFEKEYNTL